MENYYFQRCYKPIEIKMAKIEVTQKCNSRCITCNTWKIKDITLSKRDKLEPELRLEDYLQVILDLKKLGCRLIELHGGEPTLNKDLPAIIKICADLGMMTILTTNGLSMTPELARDIIDSGITRINFSLDGPKECHNYLRGRDDAFEKMTETMKMIRDADTNNRILKNINTMVSAKNISRIEEVVKIAYDNGIDMVTFVHPSIVGQNVVEKTNDIFGEAVTSFRTVCPEDLLISDTSLIMEKRELIKSEAKKYRIKIDKTNFFTLPTELISKGIKRQPKPCWDIYGCIVIDAGGNVVPCELLRFGLGNVKEKSLQDILQSERYEKFTRIYCENIERMDLCMYCVDAIY